MKSALERFRDTLKGNTCRPKSTTFWIMKYKGERIITHKGKGTWAQKRFAKASLRNMLSFVMYWVSNDLYKEYGYDSMRRKALIEKDFEEFLKEIEFIQVKEETIGGSNE